MSLKRNNEENSVRENEGTAKERYFSIELESKASLKNATLASSDGNEGVLIEGTVGRLKRVGFVDDVVLEVVGNKGVLRINLKEKEIGSDASEDTQKRGASE